MRISNITINNFKGIGKLSFDPAHPVSVFTGPNGKGKTSFLQALEFVLSGKHNEKKIIKNGEERASVSITLQGSGYPVVFTRQIVRQPSAKKEDASCLVGGRKVTETDYKKLLADALSMETEEISVMSSAQIFEEMTSQELSAFLSDHIPEGISFDRLKETLGSDYPEDAFLVLQADLEDGFNPNDLTALYDGYFKMRRDINRELKTLQAKVAVIPEKPLDKEELQAMQEDFLKKQAQAQSAKELRLAYDRAVKAYQTALENKKKLEEQAAKAKGDRERAHQIVKDAMKGDETFLVSILASDNGVPAAFDKALNARRKALLATKGNITVFQKNNALYEKTLANLDKPVCPISEKLVCSTDKTALKEELTGLVKMNQESIAREEKSAAEYEKMIADLEHVMEECRRFKFLDDSMKTAIKQAEEYKLPEKPVEPEKGKILDAEKLSEEKAILDAELKKRHLYENYEKDKKAYDAVLAKQQKYDTLVKTADPKGVVIQKLLSAYFAIFNDTCNSVAKELGIGLTFEFLSDNGVKLLCSGRDYFSLSNGEKILVTFVVTEMLSKLTGNRILFVDNLNELDSGNLMKFIQFLRKQEWYEHVFICSTDNRDFEEVLDFIPADMVY